MRLTTIFIVFFTLLSESSFGEVVLIWDSNLQLIDTVTDFQGNNVDYESVLCNKKFKSDDYLVLTVDSIEDLPINFLWNPFVNSQNGTYSKLPNQNPLRLELDSNVIMDYTDSGRVYGYSYSFYVDHAMWG